MLYNNFIVCMMVTAVFGLFHMIDADQTQYIIFPIGILIWGVFKFFDANDRKYLESKGIDPDEFNPFFPEFYDDYSTKNKGHVKSNGSSIYAPPRDNAQVNGNTITWNNPRNTSSRDTSPMYKGGFGGGDSRYMPRRYQDPTYKSIVGKCKRNFKISITEEKNESKEKAKHDIDNVA